MDAHQSRPGRTARQAAIRLFLLSCLASLQLAGAAWADEAGAWRIGAELLILSGDAHRLAHDRLGLQERAGLQSRIAGGLASLPLALRRAGADARPAGRLRAAFGRGDWQAFAAEAERLAKRFPFSPAFAATQATPARIAAGRRLHAETCAGCHDADWGDVPLPARNLNRMAAAMPRAEFAARLWLGVRATRELAYANPFDDEELAALFAYYGSSTRAR
jgi:mono/diheme cytochrome c family protein